MASGLLARGTDGGGRAGCNDGGGFGAGRSARPGRDRGLCGAARPAGLGPVPLAGVARMSAVPPDVRSPSTPKDQGDLRRFAAVTAPMSGRICRTTVFLARRDNVPAQECD